MFCKRKLLFPIIWIALVYLSIPVIRSLSEIVIENFYLKFSLLTISVLLVLFLVYRATNDKKTLFLLLLAGLLGYFYSFNLAAYEELFHYFQYGLLSILVLNSFKKEIKEPVKIITTIILVSFFGYFDEVIQYFIPRRFFDWNDVVLNFVSGVIGVIVYYSSFSNSLQKNSN